MVEDDAGYVLVVGLVFVFIAGVVFGVVNGDAADVKRALGVLVVVVAGGQGKQVERLLI